jgi:hypothetical protein
LRLLKYLRRVILQDSVILRDIFPDHPIWKYFVFHTDQYAAFREQILVVLKDKKDPANVQIKTALPLIANRMNMNIEDIKTTVLGKSKKVNNNLQGLLQQFAEFTSGKKRFTVYANPAPESVPSSTSHIFTFNSGYTDNPPFQPSVKIPTQATDSQNPLLPPHSGDISAISSAFYPFPEQFPQARFDSKLPPIIYIMRRDVTKVTELWRE